MSSNKDNKNASKTTCANGQCCVRPTDNKTQCTSSQCKKPKDVKK